MIWAAALALALALALAKALAMAMVWAGAGALAMSQVKKIIEKDSVEKRKMRRKQKSVKPGPCKKTVKSSKKKRKESIHTWRQRKQIQSGKERD